MYTVLNCLATAGAVVIAVVVTVKAAPVVAAHVEAIAYYCKTFGILKGMEIYRYQGTRCLPDGVIDWVQKDLEDGDSCLDDLADKGIPNYKRGISMQIEKDAWLLKEKRVKKVVWHFFRSDITGKVGASKPLLELLEKNGIVYIIYD